MELDALRRTGESRKAHECQTGFWRDKKCTVGLVGEDGQRVGRGGDFGEAGDVEEEYEEVGGAYGEVESGGTGEDEG